MFFFLLKELFFLFITFIDYDGSTKEQFIKASGRVLSFFCKKFPFFNSQMHILLYCCCCNYSYKFPTLRDVFRADIQPVGRGRA